MTIRIRDRLYVIEGVELTAQQVADQINAQAGMKIVEALDDGSGVKVLEKRVGSSSVIKFFETAKPIEGRVVHQELRGRRRPEGWVRREIAELRKMRHLTKAQRKKRRKQ
mgnify:CR=1 FL=1